tara:strand:- start:961 stop:2709 length:1749 start_codon:yes stop_codon:yes gene_type:complete
MIQDRFDKDSYEGRPTRVIVLKSRRHRISTLCAANIFHACIFGENKRGYIVAHDRDTSELLFRFHSTFYENLPDIIRPMKRFSNRKELLFENPSDDARLTNPGLRSSIIVRPASSGGRKIGAQQGAAGVGRGDRIDLLHASEVAFWANGEETFRGFAQSVPDEPGTMVCMESTANGQAGFFYEEWLKAQAGETEYTPIFLPWYQHPHYRSSFIARSRPEWAPTDDEMKWFDEYKGHLLIEEVAKAQEIGARLGLDDEDEDLVLEHGVGWDQLKWKKFALRGRCGGRLETFHVEYPATPEQAFTSSGTPRFSNEKIRFYTARCSKPIAGRITAVDEDWNWRSDGWKRAEFKVSYDAKGWLHIIDPPRKDHSYVIGADASHGVGQDSSAFAVFDRTERRYVAYGRDPYLKADKLAKQMIEVGWFYNCAYLAPEFNGPGMLCTHMILESGYPKLYFSQRYNTAKQKFTDQPGFYTDSKTRDMIIDRFDVALENDTIEIPVKAILDEASTFVLDTKKGRADHLPGCHDDLLFSAMIALFVDAQVSMDEAPKKEKSSFGWSKGPPTVDELIDGPGEFSPDRNRDLFL